MRKVLLAILAFVLLIVVGMIIYKGASIGKFEVWGITQIIEENDVIEQAKSDLEKLINNKYPDTEKELDNSSEKMQDAKRKYEEQAVLVSNSKYYMQTEKYKLEFLWTRIGNYAKDYKVTPKMEVESSSTKGVYNLIITVVGNYHNIASFIHAIENDSRLGFKIEDFSMIQYATDEQTNLVQARFVCKEIRIDIKSIDTESNSTKKDSSEKGEETRTNPDDKNTTSTNTTSTTNTTNPENTTNMTNNTVNSNTNTSNTDETTDTAVM